MTRDLFADDDLSDCENLSKTGMYDVYCDRQCYNFAEPSPGYW